VAVGCAFASGVFYAWFGKLPSMPRDIDAGVMPRLICGVVLLLFAYGTLREKAAPLAQREKWFEAITGVARTLLAVLAALAGMLILIRMVSGASDIWTTSMIRLFSSSRVRDLSR
jgi:hypothetical protein